MIKNKNNILLYCILFLLSFTLAIGLFFVFGSFNLSQESESWLHQYTYKIKPYWINTYSTKNISASSSTYKSADGNEYTGSLGTIEVKLSTTSTSSGWSTGGGGSSNNLSTMSVWGKNDLPVMDIFGAHFISKFNISVSVKPAKGFLASNIYAYSDSDHSDSEPTFSSSKQFSDDENFSFYDTERTTNPSAQVDIWAYLGYNKYTYNYDYVVYKPKEISITYNDGANSVKIPTLFYDNYNLPASIPTKTGYTFVGWYTASSGGNKISSNNNNDVMNSTSGKTIYAHWTAKSYKITFNQNSGSGGSSSTTVTYDKAMPNITIPKRIGYSFEGYYDSPQTDYGDTGGGTQYYKSDGTSARNWDKATDTTLYARWLPRDDYKVDINILSPTGEQDYKSGTMTQAYGSTIKEGINDQGFDNITYKESWTISKITPTPGYVLTSVSANAGTLVDNGDGTYTFTANFTSDPNGSWDAVITIQMGDTWTNYAEEPTVKRKIEVNGTTVEAREISKPEHLAWISKMLLTTSNGGYYIQTKPIDMSDHYWYPIGANGRAFTGYYNGQGYAIMNVETSPNMVTESGLFGYIQGGTVENVTMLNAKIQGGIDSGGIAGVNNGGVIRNCYVEGDITATNRGVSSTTYSIGGLVGYSTGGRIESSYYEGTISGTGNRYYGLLIGYGENSSIRDSIGKTTGNTAYYNNGVSVESSLYITGANYGTKRYYEGTFANWVITNGQPLPSGLTWVGNAGDKVTNISQITACGYSKV